MSKSREHALLLLEKADEDLFTKKVTPSPWPHA